MSNILILHSGLEGITNACLEVARRLEQNNYTVYTATVTDKQEKIEANGLSYLQVQPIQFRYLSNASIGQRTRAAILHKDSFYNTLYDEIKLSEFGKLIKAKNISGLLIDMELHEYIMYVNTINIPFVLINQWFSVWKTSGNLPLQSCYTPRSQWLNKCIWKYHGCIGLYKIVSHNVSTLGQNRRNFIKYLAKKLNFDTNTLKSYHFPLPYSYQGMPILSLTHPDLEFTAPSIDRLSYTYPMVYAEREEIISDQFRTDYEEIQKQKQNKKLIIATHTTMSDSRNNNLNNLLDALVRTENVLSIVSMGNQYSKELREKYLDKGLYIYQSIPQVKALRQADLCIHHGGIHTINECIHFAVPMVVISGNKHDQNGCAARISKHGCGITATKKNSSSEDIQSYIHKVLYTPSYKSKVIELNKKYTRAKVNKVFEKYMDDLLNVD